MEIKTFYTLFHDKKAHFLKIERKTAKNNNFFLRCLENAEQKDVVYYNDCYFVSLSRAELVKKANEIRGRWIQELQNRIDVLNGIQF